MEDVDYKKLLEKYIEYVSECKGINFINDLPKEPPFVEIRFTELEWEILNSLVK